MLIPSDVFQDLYEILRVSFLKLIPKDRRAVLENSKHDIWFENIPDTRSGKDYETYFSRHLGGMKLSPKHFYNKYLFAINNAKANIQIKDRSLFFLFNEYFQLSWPANLGSTKNFSPTVKASIVFQKFLQAYCPEYLAKYPHLKVFDPKNGKILISENSKIGNEKFGNKVEKEAIQSFQSKSKLRYGKKSRPIQSKISEDFIPILKLYDLEPDLTESQIVETIDLYYRYLRTHKFVKAKELCYTKSSSQWPGSFYFYFDELFRLMNSSPVPDFLISNISFLDFKFRRERLDETKDVSPSRLISNTKIHFTEEYLSPIFKHFERIQSLTIAEIEEFKKAILCFSSLEDSVFGELSNHKLNEVFTINLGEIFIKMLLEKPETALKDSIDLISGYVERIYDVKGILIDGQWKIQSITPVISHQLY